MSTEPQQQLDVDVPEDQLTEQPAVEPVVQEEVTPEPVVTPAPEFVYTYQPKDDAGRPMGAPQVFKGATQQEVLDKVAEANVNLIRLTRDLKKKVRLGQFEPEVGIPEDAARSSADDFEAQPRLLSAEERINISKDMLDPEKFDEASDRLLEAKLGTKPQTLVDTVKKLKADNETLKIQNAARYFREANPDYYACQENFETLANWMIKNDLAPTKENFQLAYNKLTEVGLLLEAPVREENIPVNTQPEVQTPARISVEEVPQDKRPAPKAASGLNRNNAANVGTPSQSGKLTLADIEKMPADEYRKRLRDPLFAKAVNEAYADKKR